MDSIPYDLFNHILNYTDLWSLFKLYNTSKQFRLNIKLYHFSEAIIAEELKILNNPHHIQQLLNLFNLQYGNSLIK